MTLRAILAVLALGAAPASLVAQHVHPTPAPASWKNARRVK